MGGSSKSGQTTGYRYYMGLHAGLCHGPVDSLVEIRGGDLTLWNGSQNASGSIYIDAFNVYGGDQKEGGVQGTLDVMMGEPTQGANSYLQNIIGGIQSAYRGLMSVVFNQGYIGANNPYPKPWAFRVRRATKGWQNDAPWYSSKAAITLSNGAVGMNPAHIVYETLTNRDWGMGYPTGIIDLTAFQASADQLYSEGLGLCLLWLRQDSIESWLQQIMDYSGGVLVQNKSTGLFQFNLIRGGYNVSTLPTFTRDNVVELISLESPSITGATNEIIVRWNDPTLKAKQYTQVQALGAVQAQGVVVSATRDYPGIASQDIAARVAQRELRAVSVPLKKLQVKLDRTASQLLPGGLFVLNFPDFGINSMVFRVGEVDYGTLVQGAITITAIEDVFSLPDASYVVVQNTGWVVPTTTATPAPYTKGFEATYRDLARTLSSPDLSALPSNAGYAGIVCARPSGLSINYKVNTRVGGAAFEQRGTENFCPTGVLQSNIGPFDTSITVLSGLDLDLVSPGGAAMIENEIVSVQSINAITGAVVIARGCVDTVPASHAAGARIWFSDNYVGTDGVQYFQGETVDIKPQTATTQDLLDLAATPIVSVPIVERQFMPYAPAYLTVGGARWDTVTKLSGPLALAWRERNRLTQADQLIDNTQPNVTPEAGTTYTITLRDQFGTAFYTATSVSGTSWTWPTPDDTHSHVQITVTAVRGGITSFQSQALPLTPRVGYGLNYGNDYGSV
jgi:hypothetical protein